MWRGLWRVSGVVTAPDGTSYRPLFFGDMSTCQAVRDAVEGGAVDRGEGGYVEIRAVDVAGRWWGMGYVVRFGDGNGPAWDLLPPDIQEVTV